MQIVDPCRGELPPQPVSRRLGVVFDLLDHNLATENFALFLDRWLRKIRGPITMVIDRLGAHESAARRLLVKYPARLAFERLPPHSSDPSPTAHVWGHTKYSRLASFISDDPLHRGRTVSEAFMERASGLNVDAVQKSPIDLSEMRAIGRDENLARACCGGRHDGPIHFRQARKACPECRRGTRRQVHVGQECRQRLDPSGDRGADGATRVVDFEPSPQRSCPASSKRTTIAWIGP